MTARPQLDERDPLPEPDWQPVSSAWARRQALEAAAAAVTASREKRKKPKGAHAEARRAADELIRLTEDMGLYDDNDGAQP